MIVDASALAAVALAESDAAIYGAALAAPGPKRISAVGYLETAMCVDRNVDAPPFDLDAFLATCGVEVAAVTPAQARLARAAWRRFGKGRHPARLNLGDCFAYALAAETGEPLLYKGADFARTDLASAL